MDVGGNGPRTIARRADRRRVAVLGGGMGSLAAAFELTRPQLEGRFEVTVYQLGWRLGGKGASSRNAAVHQRIEEHGLHVLLGSYENTFRLLRDCYDELGRRPGVDRFATVEETFAPHDDIVLAEKIGDRWLSWPLPFPSNQERPGRSQRQIPTPWEYVQLVVDAIGDLARGGLSELFAAPTVALVGPPSGASLLELARLVLRERDGGWREELTRTLRELRTWLVRGLERRVTTSTTLRRLSIMLELSIASVIGLVEDGLAAPPYDWFSIDDLDLRDWLRKHGASERAVRSALVQGIYDLAFSPEGKAAAGTAVQGILRMIWTYRGSVFYKMRAGMGECVFAPLYEVLRRRGVRFELFHRVDELVVSTDGTRIDAVELGVQARTRGDYDPLVDVDGLPCWPASPKYAQLEDGAALEASGESLEDLWTRWPDAGARRLARGRDFDDVVLGLSVAALPRVCDQLVRANERFAKMLEKVETTQTHALQLWMRPSIRDLGWQLPSPILDGFADPFDTWADMTHLLPEERWPGTDGPRSLAYLCGQLDDVEPIAPRTDHGYPARQRARARENARRWLEVSSTALWPRGAGGDGFDWSTLVAPDDVHGEDRLDAQYLNVPLHPSDRYVLAAPGSHRYRLRADESGFENLVLAGDWVKTGLSVGCLEAATMAGMYAARALSGASLEIIGDLPAPPARIEALPPYIERGGELVVRAPLAMQQVTMSAFMLPADRGALERLAETHLNRVSRRNGTEYRAAASFVTLAFADCRRGQASNAPDRDKGWLAERDVAFWVPLLAGRSHGGRFVAERLVWYLPYIFADNTAAVATGREIFGFPKQHAAMRFADDPGRDRGFAVDTLVIERFGIESAGEIATLIEVTPLDRAGSEAGDFLQAARAAFDVDVLGALDVAGRSTRALVQRGSAEMRTDLVFLKQFRDAADPSRACYQAVIEAAASVDVLRKGRPLAAQRVRIREVDSHPIVRELGLPSATLTTQLAGWLDFDFTMREGRAV